ncbi:hypothetical protein KR49_00025 [Synechococcus sp. KORDI-49]|nr:hypothetical protein KR49_00025 [Synechococcus sp. KORDI-49]
MELSLKLKHLVNLRVIPIRRVNLRVIPTRRVNLRVIPTRRVNLRVIPIRRVNLRVILIRRSLRVDQQQRQLMRTVEVDKLFTQL